MRKRADGFHDLETVFYPVAVQDALEVVSDNESRETNIYLTGIPVEGKKEDNICLKAYQLLQKDFSHLPPVQIHLHKGIPTGAGLGGGSADGAFTLLLLNNKFNLGLEEDALIRYALQLGSDCPFFIKNKPCWATGRGEKMQEISLDLSSYTIVLVHPKIHVPTGWAFAQIKPDETRTRIKEVIAYPLPEWKEALTNDFEEPIGRHYPEIKHIKEELYRQGAVYAAMSGSGSTVYGIFPKEASIHFSFPTHYGVHQLSGS